MSFHKYVTVGSALALVCPVVTMAQTTSPEQSATSNTLQEIIVTATRREETILEVPISIAAYTQESLDQKGVRSIEDLARITPGLSITQGFSGIKYISIRGVESRWGATTTGVYIDETPVQVRSLSISTNFYPALFDLERVEVLRGPQGTLFGAGAMGGAVRFILAKPGLKEYSGSARTEVGFTERGDWSQEAGGAIGGPLVEDKIGFRASGYYRHDGGYVDRVPFYANRGTPEENSNSRDTMGGNVAFTFAPTDSLRITPSVFYQRVDRDDTDQFWTWMPTSSREPLPKFTNAEGVASWGIDKSALYSLNAQFDAGAFSLISNTSYMDREVESRDDGTNFILDALGPAVLRPDGSGGLRSTLFSDQFANAGERATINVWMTQRSFAQELRLQSNQHDDSRLSYVLGLYYQKLRQTVYERDSAVVPEVFSPNFVAPLFGLPAGIPIPLEPDGAYAVAFDETRDEQYAAFLNLDYQLTDRLTVSAGARISRMEFDFLGTSAFVGIPDRASGHTKETPVTPKFGVEYKTEGNWLFYASAAEGFRPGGANRLVGEGSCVSELQALGMSQVPASYKPDSVWSYEIGAKGRLGRLVTISSSVFDVEWTDRQQLRTLLPCGSVFIDNLGDARSLGFDALITLNPLDGLSFDLGVGYQDTTFQDTIYAAVATNPKPIVSSKGDRLATPWIANFAADYETSLGAGGLRGYGHLQYDYRSDWEGSNPRNQSYDRTLAETEAQHYVSARVGTRRGPLDISLFVNNLLDSQDVIGKLNFRPSERLLVQTYRPRTWGLTANYRF
ncbi:TonB-dependent receptor [Steroidobacter flavus]|uniref:TonB-dependent receptor n=1 Tax=Steroidobacter flavus TaxID=1842136 RepID=A0ABV8T2N7_9GAMM